MGVLKHVVVSVVVDRGLVRFQLRAPEKRSSSGNSPNSNPALVGSLRSVPAGRGSRFFRSTLVFLFIRVFACATAVAASGDLPQSVAEGRVATGCRKAKAASCLVIFSPSCAITAARKHVAVSPQGSFFE